MASSLAANSNPYVSSRTKARGVPRSGGSIHPRCLRYTGMSRDAADSRRYAWHASCCDLGDRGDERMISKDGFRHRVGRVTSFVLLPMLRVVSTSVAAEQDSWEEKDSAASGGSSAGSGSSEGGGGE